MSGSNLSPLLAALLSQPKKPRVFVSYHHGNDQGWYDRFNTVFSGKYDLFTDTSLERKVNSTNVDYIDRRIREDFIGGSSVTVVLCGAETWKRKYVDWEIHATLLKKHTLLGIVLPTNPQQLDGTYAAPDRLLDNATSGYAHWIHWSEDPLVVDAAIRTAQVMANTTASIRNGRTQMPRNLP